MALIPPPSTPLALSPTRRFLLPTPPIISSPATTTTSKFVLYSQPIEVRRRRHLSTVASYRLRGLIEEEEEEEERVESEGNRFEEAAALFNNRDYYKCHDVLEELWNDSEEPKRTLFHGILQCAVGFHHLFNQNHKGAMMEFGEGVCKLRKMNFKSGPFLQFERDISAVLDFIYLTQLELAACTNEYCVALDQSERSYQLLGKYAAGQRLYVLDHDQNNDLYIVFCTDSRYQEETSQPRVRVPLLQASHQHLLQFEYN